MDRSNKGPSLASPTQEAAKSAPAPKLRRKLQKLHRPGSGEVPNYNGASNTKFDTPPRISLPQSLGPDLSDTKWSEYLRSSGNLCATLLESPNTPNSPQGNDFSVKLPTTTIPELAHLSSPTNHDAPRSSVDSSSSESSDASMSMRRRAKTPVFHVGQLEARARARKLEAANKRAAEMREGMDDAYKVPALIWSSGLPKPKAGEFGANKSDAGQVTLKQTNTKEASTGNMTLRETNVKEVIVKDASRVSRVPRIISHTASIQEKRMKELSLASGASKIDHIAESYRTLIGAEDSSRFADSPRPETSDSSHSGRETLTIRHKRRSGDLRRDSQIFEHASDDEPPQSSPTSDGTLVAFDEETIYFKPMSPLYSVVGFESPSIIAPPTPNNIGLKICVDLLAKDLASAVTGNDRGEGPPEASALQIWTMIEAYEKLQDRIMGLGWLKYDEMLGLQQSINTWLKGLYAAHDRLTGGASIYQENA